MCIIFLKKNLVLQDEVLDKHKKTAPCHALFAHKRKAVFLLYLQPVLIDFAVA